MLLPRYCHARIAGQAHPTTESHPRRPLDSGASIAAWSRGLDDPRLPESLSVRPHAWPGANRTCAAKCAARCFSDWLDARLDPPVSEPAFPLRSHRPVTWTMAATAG